jgi:alkaline phosphatase
MVPDGCSMSIQTLARLYKGKDINLDRLLTGSVRTYSANSVITDSAAAATAFATGHKTTSSFIGVAPRTEDLLPWVKSEVRHIIPCLRSLRAQNYPGDQQAWL